MHYGQAESTLTKVKPSQPWLRYIWSWLIPGLGYIEPKLRSNLVDLGLGLAESNQALVQVEPIQLEPKSSRMGPEPGLIETT